MTLHQSTKLILLFCIVFWGASCRNSGTKSIEDFKSTSTENNPGAVLFSSKCSMCHAFQEDKVGPSLSGALQRWNNDPIRLKNFIRNSNAVIQSGDPYAKALYEKWNRAAMPPFTNLSDEELDQLIDYLK